MPIGPALPPDQRAAVEQLLRDTELTMAEIGRRTGVSRHTVCTWNVRAGRPRPRRLSRRNGPAAWRSERREALVRLYREPRNDPGDIAEAAGVGRASASALFRAFGLPPRSVGDGRSRPVPRAGLTPLDAASVADAPTLRAHLRAHIARQIAAFDAALRGEGAAMLDSARVLRDLGGLKRLFDEIAEVDGPVGLASGLASGLATGLAAGRGDDGAIPDGSEPDLPALRAEIAQRYARFVGEPDPG